MYEYERAWERALYWTGHTHAREQVERPVVRVTSTFFRAHSAITRHDFTGFCLSPRTVLLHERAGLLDLPDLEDLVTHEYIHSLQWQEDGSRRFLGAYLRHRYENNPYEKDANLGVEATRALGHFLVPQSLYSAKEITAIEGRTG